MAFKDRFNKFNQKRIMALLVVVCRLAEMSADFHVDHTMSWCYLFKQFLVFFFSFSWVPNLEWCLCHSSRACCYSISVMCPSELGQISYFSNKLELELAMENCQLIRIRISNFL